MKQKIDWLNHTLEFLVVFIGILIAFQLNKCAETKTKNELVENHLKYIQEECGENIARLDEGIIHSKAQLKFADSLLLEIREQKRIWKIRQLSTVLLNLQNKELKEDAYSVLVQSGDIRFMNDFQRKRKIITLYESFDGINITNENVLKIYDNHFYPYLKSNFDLVNWDYNSTQNISNEPSYYAGEFGNIISTYRFLLQTKIDSYEAIRDKISQFLDEK